MTFKDNREYRDMHYYLESGYRWGEGMDANAMDKFHEEIISLFEKADWAVKWGRSSGVSPTVTKGWSSLYLHPMDASGAVEKDLVSEVREILNGGTTFTVTGERDCGQLYNWTDDEYLAYLEEQREEVERRILAALKTKRSNLYGSGSVFDGKLKSVYNMVKVNRLSGRYCMCSSDVDVMFIERVRDELVEQGKLVTGYTKAGLCYRTAKGVVA